MGNDSTSDDDSDSKSTNGNNDNQNIEAESLSAQKNVDNEQVAQPVRTEESEHSRSKQDGSDTGVEKSGSKQPVSDREPPSADGEYFAPRDTNENTAESRDTNSNPDSTNDSDSTSDSNSSADDS